MPRKPAKKTKKTYSSKYKQDILKELGDEPVTAAFLKATGLSSSVIHGWKAKAQHGTKTRQKPGPKPNGKRDRLCKACAELLGL